MKRTKAREKEAQDVITLRGGIELSLRNALTGEEIEHATGDNAVLYIGRNMVMTRSMTSVTNYPLMPCIVIGSGSGSSSGTTANAMTGPHSYFTFKTGGFASTTQSGGTNVPVMNFTGSWESTELSVAGFGSVREFCLAFNSASNSGSSNATYFCRYVSTADISATTSNQLLVTYTVSW